MLVFVLFIKVWVGIISVPLVETPDIPIGWTVVQLKVAPGEVLFNVTKVEVSPEQIIWLVGEKVTTGDGFTVKTAVVLQPALLVKVIVVVPAAIPVTKPVLFTVATV